MADDWFKRFQDFSMTVDFVDDDLMEDVTSLLESSFEEAWRICFFRVLLSGYSIQTDTGDVPALNTVWAKTDSKMGDMQIAKDNGDPTNQTTYAFLFRKPLWIRATDGSKLTRHTASPECLVNEWPGLPNPPTLPAYRDYGGGDSRTSVVLPLHYGGRMFGVINLEFLDSIEISTRAMKTANQFAESLARIFWLHETNRTQLNDSQDALRRLQTGYDTAAHAFRGRTVFLASSGRADKTVVETLRAILETEFAEYFSVEYWAEDSSSGGINDQVRASIAAAEFGICYMSEPVKEPVDNVQYFDNPNVLFEAGMFQMAHQLRDDASDYDAARWIPVRENMDITTPLPFDFASDRILTIPRVDGEVDVEKFTEQIRKAVKDLIFALGID